MATNPYDKRIQLGFLNAACTLARSLLVAEWSPGAVLTNEPVEGGVRWWDLRPGGFWVARTAENLTGGPFPYGYALEPE